MKREDTGAKTVIRALCRAFLVTESIHWDTSIKMELHFSALSDSLSYKVGNAQNTEFTLTSSNGDVQTTILLGRPVNRINVTIKNLTLCYQKN